MNMNKFAKEITLQEGKKKSLSIAQVKEVITLTLKKLAGMPAEDVFVILKRYGR